jgi:hypothetical protein
VPDTPKDDIQWEDAIAQVNRWRGDCLQSFAQSETAITETLLLLNAAAVKGSSVKLPHLIGQRFEALKLATGLEGAFASEGAKRMARFQRSWCTRNSGLSCAMA